jgi:hypothetical protein
LDWIEFHDFKYIWPPPRGAVGENNFVLHQGWSDEISRKKCREIFFCVCSQNKCFISRKFCKLLSNFILQL